jgi:hypothetical protein
VNSARVCVGEKVGYISNFDNTMLRKSRVQGFCELQGGGDVCGEKVGYINNCDNTMLRKSRVQDHCELHEGVCREKVGYISNFDSTMLRKSRLRNYCGPPNLHGVEKNF